jgi:hypothetical protein
MIHDLFPNYYFLFPAVLWKGRKDLFFKNRLPRLAQLYPVYAIIVILVYGWTIGWVLWKLPSWLDYLPYGEIGAIFSYLMATNLIESLFVLLVVVVVCFLLPRKWFCEVFVSRGSVFIAATLIPIMFFEYHFDNPVVYSTTFPLYLAQIILAAGVLAFFAGWIRAVRKVVESIAENAVIFLYLSVPISLLCVIVVVFRNLL